MFKWRSRACLLYRWDNTNKYKEKLILFPPSMVNQVYPVFSFLEDYIFLLYDHSNVPGPVCSSRIIVISLRDDFYFNLSLNLAGVCDRFN